MTLLVLLLGAISPAHADEISDKRAEAQRIAKQLNDLRNKQMALEGEYNEANLKLNQANNDIATAQVRVDAVSKEYEQRKGQARTYAISAYIDGNDSPAMEALLTAEGDQAPRKQGYLEAATGNRQDAVDQLNLWHNRLDDEIGKLNQAKGDAQSATDKAAGAKEQNESAVAEQNQLNNRVQGELGQLVAEEQARQAEETRKANEAKLAQLRAAEAAQTATTKAPAPPTTTSREASGTTAPSTTSAPSRAQAPAPAPSAPGPKPAPAPGPSPAPVPPSSKGAAAASAAMSQLGVRYTYGGASPQTGFDCSGLVMWAYGQVGVSLPHATSAQWGVMTPISMSELQVGDVVFFYGMGHNAIYIGGGMVVHAPHTGDVVRTIPISQMPVTGARRVR